MSDIRKAYGRRRYDEDYEPEPERVDCPDDIDSAVRDEFETVVMKLVKKIDAAFSRMGWRVNHGINDNDIDDGVQRFEYEFELSVKGGQKLIADRKKIVADGNYQPSFIIRFLSDAGETEQDTFEEEYWSGRYDDYDLSTRSHWVEYTCGGTTLDYFEVEALTRGSVSKKMERAYYTERDISRFVVEYTKSFFANNSRSKWKRRASLIADRYMDKGDGVAENSIKKIADRYLGFTKEGGDTFASFLDDLGGVAADWDYRGANALASVWKRKATKWGFDQATINAMLYVIDEIKEACQRQSNGEC